MSDQADTERKRRERARLAAAFERRAWQPSERSKLPVRLLGGGVALAVVAAGTFGIGALISYQQGIEDDQKRRQAALHQRVQPVVTTPTPPPTPSPARTSTPPSPKRKATSSSPPSSTTPTTSKRATARKTRSSRFPTGPNFSTTTGVLLRNAMTGMCVDVPGRGDGSIEGRVQQDTCSRSTADNQLWDLVVNQKGAGPKGSDLFTIRNYKDGLCLDIVGTGDVEPTTRVMQMYCYPGDTDNQMWFLDRRKSGQFLIRNYAARGKCLDVGGVGGSGGRGAELTMFPCDLKDDHLWSFR